MSERLNRRKIDLIPEPDWADPPKARIDELLAAVEARLAAAGIAGLPEAVAIARGAATDAGLADPRVTSDAKHVEIGLTDKSDSARWIMRELWRRGIAPGQVLIAGDEFGPLGGLAGSDSFMLVPSGATAVSVGVEPSGVPAGVVRLGGARDVRGVLEDQIARRRRGELPLVEPTPGGRSWSTGVDPLLERAHESLLTLADGRLGTRGSVLAEQPSGDPAVLMSGVYTRRGAETHLLAAPRWNAIARRRLAPTSGAPRARSPRRHAAAAARSADRTARRAAALLARATRDRRAQGQGPQRGRARGRPLAPPPGPTRDEGRAATGAAWMRVSGRPGSIAAAARDQLTRHRRQTGCSTASPPTTASPEAPADQHAALDRLATRAQRLGFDGLLAEHRRAWASRWEDADILIEGDPELQLASGSRCSTCSRARPTSGEAAVGARGLSGNGVPRPRVLGQRRVRAPVPRGDPPARGAGDARVPRPAPARRDAAATRRAARRRPLPVGVRRHGSDVTPEHARDRRGELVPIRTGELEEHIVADVAWAAACYIDWTGDETFAAGPGRELLVETARYWASRIESDEHGPRPHPRRDRPRRVPRARRRQRVHERDGALEPPPRRGRRRRTIGRRARAAPLARARRRARRRLRPRDRDLRAVRRLPRARAAADRRPRAAAARRRRPAARPRAHPDAPRSSSRPTC